MLLRYVFASPFVGIEELSLLFGACAVYMVLQAINQFADLKSHLNDPKRV